MAPDTERAGDDRTICYSCFEAEADEEWWEMLRSLPVAADISPDTSREVRAPETDHVGPERTDVSEPSEGER